MKKFAITIFTILLFSGISVSQVIKQTVSGVVRDKLTQEALPFATVVLLNSDPLIGVSTDIDGTFKLESVPVGRQSLRFSMVGYETYIMNEMLVSSGRETNLTIELDPASTALDEVVVKVRKDKALNTMSTLSSRQFTVEETQRYAGGLNDPARLASSFAGVATPSVSSNGISVRGNSPNGLLWQIEGVEVPNPNHFANLTVAGGGLFTAISNQMMGNSDFHTGAFPAEFGNATSGVFDIRLKTGNTSQREYTLQAGVIGVDFAAEGPFIEGSESSYLMNYRNSTMALLSPLLPDNTGVLKYQDLAFKTNFPTGKAGTFSLWGIGALDGQQMEAADTANWQMHADRDNSATSLYMFAGGLSHTIRLGSRTFLKSSLAATGSGLSHQEKRLGYDLVERPQSDVNNDSWRYTIQSDLRHHFGQRHSNHTGFKYSHMGYQIEIDRSREESQVLMPLAGDKGQSGLLQLYTQSRIQLTPRLTVNAGLHSQLFLLNDNHSLEPRLGVEYQINPKHSLAMAYGLHSRLEQLPVYFVKQNNQYPNTNLDLMQSAHYVMSYNVKINDRLRLCVEPYYQQLRRVPVAPDSYLSTVNFEEELFFNENLVSEGTGRNIGMDLTLERFLDKGFYYLVTASVFDSRYTGADGVERNTRFNRNYVINALAGKEWAVGKNKNNLLSANVRLNYMGGLRKDPIDQAASRVAREVIYAETSGDLAFEKQFADEPIVSFTLSYRINKPGHSSVWSLQVLNALGNEEFDTDYYNLQTGRINTRYTGITVPNLSYTIEF
jgi:hypothetical protein